jgi:rare lipoprotein A
MQGKRAKSETARARVQLPNLSRGAGSAPALAEPSAETGESVDAEAEVMPLPRLLPEKAIAMFVSPAPPLPVRSPVKARSAARSETPPLPVRTPEEARISIADSLLQQTGRASSYALDSLTANGEKLDHAALTAAHNYLPFGTKVRIENIANGLSVVVRINDRGPFVGGRIIDLSRAAAEALDMLAEGVVDVRLRVVYGRVASTSGG